MGFKIYNPLPLEEAREAELAKNPVKLKQDILKLEGELADSQASSEANTIMLMQALAELGNLVTQLADKTDTTLE